MIFHVGIHFNVFSHDIYHCIASLDPVFVPNIVLYIVGIRFFIGEEQGTNATTAVATCSIPFSDLQFGRQQVRLTGSVPPARAIRFVGRVQF